MNAYLAQIRMNLRLTLRDRAVVFFNYVLPLIFFFLFGQMMHAEQGAATQMVSMVLTIGVLVSGLMGAGMRAATEREQNILRRFKVAPITAAPILVSSLVVGLIQYLLQVIMVLELARVVYHMPPVAQAASLLVFLSVGLLAFRALGGVVAAVVNSAQESQILTQLLYLPMLLLGGATIPIAAMPTWLQSVSQFFPSTHFSTGMQAILLRHETIFDNLPALGALALTAAVATFLGVKLFRWEKEEKVGTSAKLWLAAVMAPFLVMGAWDVHAKNGVTKATILARDLRRGRTYLIRDVRLFVGDGTVSERGAVLIREGKIAQVFDGAAPDPKSLQAEPIEGAGKTLLPGLIDARVHLAATGGFSAKPSKDPDKDIDRELAAYLYCGVTAVKSYGDPPEVVLRHRASMASGEKLGAELFLDLGTAAGGAGAFYVPALTAVEAAQEFSRGSTTLLERSLVAQVAPPDLLAETRKRVASAAARGSAARLDEAQRKAVESYRAGAVLVTGTDSGIPLLFHGPAIHRELQLWVTAGIPPAAALQGATYNAARSLPSGDRIGLIRAGYDASLLLVDGNPLQDITATERISSVFFKGERVQSAELLE